MDQTEAIITRSVEFSETSLILTLFSRDLGKIRAIAKGGRRIKGPFESSLDLLARVRIGVIRKKSDALDILTESKLQNRFRPTAKNFAGLYAGYTAAELLNELTEEGEPNLPLYDLFRYTLEDFQQGTFVLRSLIRFEWILLELSGMQPSLDRCVECGRETEGMNESRVAFGHLDGGVLCPHCRPGHTQVALVRTDTIRALRNLVRRTGSFAEEYRRRDWTQLPLERIVLGEMRGLTQHYLIHLLGKKPRLFAESERIATFDRSDEPSAERTKTGTSGPGSLLPK